MLDTDDTCLDCGLHFSGCICPEGGTIDMSAKEDRTHCANCGTLGCRVYCLGFMFCSHTCAKKAPVIRAQWDNQHKTERMGQLDLAPNVFNLAIQDGRPDLTNADTQQRCKQTPELFTLKTEARP